MNTILQLLKETFQLIFIIFLIGLTLKLFFRLTLVGKIFAVVCRDIWLSIKLSWKIVKRIGKFTYKTGAKGNKYLMKRLQNSSKLKTNQKKVVNGNVIDFKTVKQLKHKWNK